jgi:hypothetical protein
MVEGVLILSGSFEPLHQCQAQPFFTDDLAIDRSDQRLIALAEELEERSRIILHVIADEMFFEDLNVRRRLKPDISRIG